MADAQPRRPLFDHELARLRTEWMDAYRAWIGLTETRLTGHTEADEQRAAYRRYRTASAAYFQRLHESLGHPTG